MLTDYPPAEFLSQPMDYCHETIYISVGILGVCSRRASFSGFLFTAEEEESRKGEGNVCQPSA